MINEYCIHDTYTAAVFLSERLFAVSNARVLNSETAIVHIRQSQFDRKPVVLVTGESK